MLFPASGVTFPRSRKVRESVNPDDQVSNAPTMVRCQQLENKTRQRSSPATPLRRYPAQHTYAHTHTHTFSACDQLTSALGQRLTTLHSSNNDTGKKKKTPGQTPTLVHFPRKHSRQNGTSRRVAARIRERTSRAARPGPPAAAAEVVTAARAAAARGRGQR